ncbi:alpha carbonic anhydrase [Podospora aff. communis PSN243]|uniref:carbonic anhydrase n=1 Tax=Podospora aff. communis PSN243 TaxID=3040156 RepID=A0AAV9G465_9PEZI|nr:alpha carbonic anhydrase [Podospora aff. communis PSN243]
MGGRALTALFLAALAREVLASCAYGTHLQPRAEGQVKVNTFGYTGQIGPLNWHALDAANGACLTGRQQSPIDMVAGSFNMIPSSELALDIPDFTAGTEFENLGTTVEVIAKGGTLGFGGKSFALQQFHFHLPSEHLDNGTSQAMEMHMVWQSEQQEIAVIGMYIQIATEGAAPVASALTQPVERRGRFSRRNTELERRQNGTVPTGAVAPSVLLETVFSVADAVTTPGTKVETPPLIMSEVVSLLKANSFQGYMGSLTTPPCSEGVNWLVSTARLGVSATSFLKVRDIIGFNSRFPQNAPGQPNVLQFASTGLAVQNSALSGVSFTPDAIAAGGATGATAVQEEVGVTV